MTRTEYTGAGDARENVEAEIKKYQTGQIRENDWD